MPRLRRIMAAGFQQHVIQRGNNRQACFFAQNDYLAYLHWLDRAARTYGVAVHAYALMTNHVHLLVTPGLEGGVSRMMQYLGRHYVQYVNKAHGRSGTLWEQRFHATVIETEFMLALYRYIDLNPVRAGLVEAPEMYPWSSARAHLAQTKSPLLLDHDVYLRLGASGEARAGSYAALIRTPLEKETLAQIRAVLHQGGVLGSDRFKDQIENLLGRRVRLGKPGRKPKATLVATAGGGVRPLVFGLLSLIPSLSQQRSADD